MRGAGTETPVRLPAAFWSRDLLDLAFDSVGMRIPTNTRVTPYIELRPELGGGNRLVLTTGLLF